MTQDALSQNVTLYRGLMDVYIDRTEISMIDATGGRLILRGYPFEDLVAKSTFEETTFLLINGYLPDADELSKFIEDMRSCRSLPEPIIDIIAKIKHAHPMDVLRTVVSALAAFDPETSDNSIPAIKRKSTRLLSQSAVAVATHHALRSDRDPVAPDDNLDHAANFLLMLTGTAPTEVEARVLNEDFILHAEHGSNASSFTGRVIASGLSSYHAAVAGAVASFEGPLHGGAINGVAQMVEEIGSPDRVEAYVMERRRKRERIMGFGHRVYKTADPRARVLRKHVELLSGQKGKHVYLEILERIRGEMKGYARHGVNINDDFYGSVSYKLLGIEDDLCAAVFSLCRMVGWTAQIIEQVENNILIRPLLHYTGKERQYAPLHERPTRQMKEAV